MKDIATKVHQLKSSFTVEGTPLFKSDRFTSEEIEQMKKDSTCHVSHWYGFGKNDKVWKDEEIAVQIEVFFATPVISEVKFKDIASKAMKALPLQDKDRERKVFRELLFGILNWTEEKNGISKMWSKFGSAPSASDGKFHGNEKLEKYAKLYGACSMTTVFDGEFSEKFHLFWYSVNHALHDFESYWDEEKRKKDLKAQEFSSPYKDLDDIEENVVMKKIPEAAKAFYLDKTKAFQERVKVFSKHGESESSIFEPSDPDLAKIFKVYMESDWLQRHEMVDCADIVYSWVDSLKRKRRKLDWSNPYHPKVKENPRNYSPKPESADRLYKYYMEKIFLEGVGSFEFDW